MNAKLKSIYWKLKRPYNVATALKQIVNPEVVNKLLFTENLLESVAKEQGYDPGSLLLVVAESLGLAALMGSFLPDYELLKKLNFSKEQIESQKALIARHKEVSVLLVQDLTPELIKLAKNNNLELCLGLGSQIQTAWQSKDFNKVTNSQLQEIFKNLITDASSLQADSISLSLESGVYSFSANLENYEGKLHPLVLKELENWLSGKNLIKIKLFVDREVIFSARQDRVLIKWKKVLNKVFLIEDDRLFATVLKSTLEKSNYKVSVFFDAETALESLNENIPDLVITDLHLPGLSGEQFLEKFRELHAEVPFIVLTSEPQELKEVELVLKGVGAYLKKDEDIRIILAWCSQLINRC